MKESTPGWYPDPTQASALRWWDGRQWADPAGSEWVQYGQPAGSATHSPWTSQGGTNPQRHSDPSNARSPGPKPSSRPWRISAIAIVMLAAGFLTVRVIDGAHRSQQLAKRNCITPAPVGASPAALAYLHAIALATPGWQQIDATIASEGNVAHRDDLLAEITVDTGFRQALGTITFPPAIAPDAQALTGALDAYIALLGTGYADVGFLAQHRAENDQLIETRAEASRQLRQDLALPPPTCAFRIP